MRLVGYARVSTLEQETNLQRDALTRAGVEIVFEEKASGISKRPALQRAMAHLAPGDVLIVWKLDRIARSLLDLLDVMRRLKAASCSIRSLTEPVDTSTPIGEFLIQILGAVAQFERALIRERCIAGQIARLERGGTFGRPRALAPQQEAEVRALLLGGATFSECGRLYGVHRHVIRRVFKELKGESIPDRLGALKRRMLSKSGSDGKK